MAKVISSLNDAIYHMNILYEGDSTSPTSGDEDYLVWTGLLNIGVNLWENEEGMLWKELFVKLTDAPDGDKVAIPGTRSYNTPALFKFPASGYVWVGTGNNKTAYKVIAQEDVQLYENSGGNWCYFLMDPTPTLEFNPNGDFVNNGGTIHYNYYKNATALTVGASLFEMSDPMFAVYYALSELKKEEGDTSSLTIATQKLEGMKTKNIMPTYWQEDSFVLPARMGGGFGQ